MRINVRFGADKNVFTENIFRYFPQLYFHIRYYKKNFIINKRYSSGYLANILKKKGVYAF